MDCCDLLCLNSAQKNTVKEKYAKILRAVISMPIPKVKSPLFYFLIVLNIRCYCIMENTFLFFFITIITIQFHSGKYFLMETYFEFKVVSLFIYLRIFVGVVFSPSLPTWINTNTLYPILKLVHFLFQRKLDPLWFLLEASQMAGTRACAGLS